MKNKVLVGHALKNDLDVLFLSHPKLRIRDTSRFKPYMRVKNKFGKLRPRALRDLTKEFLGKVIQEGEHDSAEDARCAVYLYRLKMVEWEQSLVEGKQAKVAAATANEVIDTNNNNDNTVKSDDNKTSDTTNTTSSRKRSSERSNDSIFNERPKKFAKKSSR